jgi:hypothetical protein
MRKVALLAVQVSPAGQTGKIINRNNHPVHPLYIHNVNTAAVNPVTDTGAGPRNAWEREVAAIVAAHPGWVINWDRMEVTAPCADAPECPFVFSVPAWDEYVAWCRENSPSLGRMMESRLDCLVDFEAGSLPEDIALMRHHEDSFNAVLTKIEKDSQGV